jgi:molecular chaperone GrpE (heat shock protein)
LARAHDFVADSFSRGESDLCGRPLESPGICPTKCELRSSWVSAKLAAMSDLTNWKVPKWPFFLADALLLGFAYFFTLRAPQSMQHWEIAVACVAFGAVLSLTPFYLDYRAMGKALEVNALGAVVEKIQNLEKISQQISSATNQLTVIQDLVQAEAGKTTAVAKSIADQMAGEARQFSELMQKMNESEKAALRLEVEKLHRGETEWLQILVRILDHVFALHTAAVRTGDPKFAEPVTNFQNACREIAHRIGLVPFVAEQDEPFSAERHQVAGGKENPPAGAVTAETVGTGFTFQGKLLRPAIVRLREENPSATRLKTATEVALAGKSAGKVTDGELPL